MASKAAGLTALQVQRIRAPGMHAHGSGLYLQVISNAALSWIFRYQLNGRR